MSRIGRRDTALARLVDVALAHIYGPSTDRFVEDFRYLGRGEWDVPVGDERAVANGNPQPGEPLGESDIKSADFDGVDDYVATDSSDPVPTGTSSFSSFTLLNADSVGDPGPFYGNRASGDAGHDLEQINGNTYRALIEDNSGNTSIPDFGTAVAGTDQSVAAIYDRGSDDFRGAVDGVIAGTGDLSTLGDLSGTAGEMQYGTRPAVSSHFDGSLALVAEVADWISEPVDAFIDALLRTGDVAPGTVKRLESWLSGNMETGWKRKPLPYLERYGLWNDVVDCWDRKRCIWRTDGEGVARMADLSGSLLYDQRTGSSQPVSRGTATRGTPVDYLEFDGSDIVERSDASATSYDQGLVYAVVEDRGTNDPIIRESGGNTAYIRLRIIKGSPDVARLRIQNDDGNAGQATASVDASKRLAIVGKFDRVENEVRVVAIEEGNTTLQTDVNGSPGIGANSVSVQDHAIGDLPGGSGRLTGDLYSTGFIPGVYPSDSDQDDLCRDLAKREGLI